MPEGSNPACPKGSNSRAFSIGIALCFLGVEVAQYVAQVIYSRYLGNKIKKLIKKMFKDE